MRIVFMGTPEFAVEPLEAMILAGYDVVGVVTQPDRPVGRKGKLTPPPVKICAQKYEIPVLQYERIRRQEGRNALLALKPDLFVTAAFGQILSAAVLAIPPLGTINVHASLLPQYRGSAPINWCLINGETKTGITTMKTDIGIDTGDMLLRDEIEIDPDENAAELTERLSKLGANTLLRTLSSLEEGSLHPVEQNETDSSYYPMLDKTLGCIDWKKTSQQIHNLVRGVNPWPGAYTYLGNETLKVWKTALTERNGLGLPSGTVLESDPKKGLFIACGEGVLQILEVQAPGSKKMKTSDFLRGKSVPEGTCLRDVHAE